ncbi:MAG: class I SAM-dependent methyltransferase [Chitinophagales bacterium]|nr:class I SAM-dependent methyltransferase [Chitinophagales bacterium]
MSVIIHQTSCPCCNGFDIQEVLLVQDYTVSKETFPVWQCNSCSIRFTQDIPDENSISPYYKSVDYISHSDTNEGIINKLYHTIRKFTLKSKRALIEQQTKIKKGNLLDIGAGTGAFVNVMQDAGWQVKGLESDETARKIAFQKFNYNFQLANTLYNLEKEQYDAITLWHVLEHVHDLHGYMQKFYELLKPNGKLFIAVPNYTSADAIMYKKYWAAYDVPRHLYHFSPNSIDFLAKKYNFLITAYKAMWFDSFYISMLSEKYQTGQENFLMAVINGCISNFKTLFDVKRCSSIIYVLQKI